MNDIASSKSPAENSYNLRIFLLLCGITLFVGLILLRMFTLQVVNHGYYEALASNQHEFEKTIQPKRGEIYLTSSGNEEVLVATNITKNLVYVSPKDIVDPTNVAAKLAPVLEMEAKDITEKIKTGNKNYTVLKKRISEETSELIKEMDLTGVHLEPETFRFYPEGSLASHVLGFVGFQGEKRVGQYGVEGRFEKSLAGTEGILGTETDVAGRWITLANRSFTPASDGDSIYLTIDSAIQFKAQEVLDKTIKQHNAEGGSVVVVDPKTGAILALANSPGFDPNEYSKVNSTSDYGNRAIALDYEPGSIFKPLTMAAAINEGKVTPETTYEDTGVVEMDDFKIKNSDGLANGVQNMTQVLEKSLNTGMVFVEQQLGHGKFRDYVKKFGFGKLTEIALPGEVMGNIDNISKKGDIFFATASFGQGITATPIQMMKAYTAIANGGKMMNPYFVSKIVHPDNTEEAFYPEEIDQVIDSKTAATVSAMMVNVVENGHGKRAGVKGYYIAGKTGTAQVAHKDRAGYDPTKSIGSFVGFGPVEDPAFLMLVKIENPKEVRFAESTAAPAFGEIASFILNYKQISPVRQ